MTAERAGGVRTTAGRRRGRHMSGITGTFFAAARELSTRIGRRRRRLRRRRQLVAGGPRKGAGRRALPVVRLRLRLALVNARGRARRADAEEEQNAKPRSTLSAK